MMRLSGADLLTDDLVQGVELVGLALFFGAIAASMLRLAYLHAQGQGHGRHKTTRPAVRPTSQLSEAEELSEHMLEEARPGGTQENWTLGERMAYYVGSHPMLWRETLPLSRTGCLSVPQEVMDKHFPPLAEKDIPHKER